MKLTNTNIHNIKRNLTIQHININGVDVALFHVAELVKVGYNGTQPILNLNFNVDLHKIYKKLADDLDNYIDSHFEFINSLSNVKFVIINDEIKMTAIKDNTMYVFDTDN